MTTEQLVHDLGDTLHRTLSDHSAVREPAERALQGVLRSPEAWVGVALIGQGAGGYAVEVRTLALILLRNKVFTPPIGTTESRAPFDQLSERDRGRVEACLMGALRDEFDGRVRRAVGECVARWAREGAGRGCPLSGLPQTILSLAATTSPLHRLTVYHLLVAYPDILFASPTQSVTPHQVVQVLAGGMDDPVQEVKVEAVRAVAAVLVNGVGMEQLDKGERERCGAGLVAKVCGILGTSPATSIEPVMDALTEIAESHAVLFTPNVLSTLVPILHSFTTLPARLSAALPPSLQCPPPPQALDEFDECYARFTAAVNLFVTLLQRGKKAALVGSGTYRVAMDMVPVLLAWLAVGISPYDVGSRDEQINSQAWIERDDTEEEDDEYTEMPEFALEAFAAILSQPEFLQSLFQYIPAMIEAPDWRLRAAALEAIGAISMVTVDAVTDKLEQVLDMVARVASDPHPRVLFAVADAVGNLAEVFDSDLTASNRQKCFEILKYLLSNPTNRVAEHAAQALVPLIDASEQKDVVPHLGDIVSGLVALLQNRPLYVQQQALKTLASAAITVNDAFKPFYQQLMPDLLGMLSTPMDKEHRMLKAVGIECAAFIGLAAGKQTFKEDAKRLAGIMMRIYQSITEDDDPQLGYLASTWSYVADALGEEFEPWVAPVMESMLRGARQPVQVKAYQDDSQVDDGWEVIDDQYLLNTSALEDRLTHVQQLEAICASLGPRLMRPYLDEVARCCVENLEFKLDENVRAAAAGLIPIIAKYAKATQSTETLETILTALPDMILREEDLSALSALYGKLDETLEIIQTRLPEALALRLTKASHFHLSAMGEQRVRRRELVADDEVGEDELGYERGQEEQEDEVLDAMGRVLYALDRDHPLLFTIGGLRGMGVADK